MIIIRNATDCLLVTLPKKNIAFANKIAQMKGIKIEEVAEVTTENALGLFTKIYSNHLAIRICTSFFFLLSALNLLTIAVLCGTNLPC